MTIVANTFLMNSYHHGIGRHSYYMTSDQISQTFKWLWAAKSTNLLAVFLVKVSICLSFLRLVPPKGIHQAVIHALITALGPSVILMSLIYFLECRPIQKVWKPEIPGTCFGEPFTVFITGFHQRTSAIFHTLSPSHMIMAG